MNGNPHDDREAHEAREGNPSGAIDEPWKQCGALSARAQASEQAAAECDVVQERLHDQGHTIILVTHEKDIADHARRTISIRDGKIEKDEARVRA